MKKLIQQDILTIQNTIVYRQIGHYTCVNLSLYEDTWHIAPFYWRIVDKEFSLVEIGIDPLTGQFLSVNVIFYNGFIERKTIDYLWQHQLDDQLGIPTFSTQLWSGVAKENFHQRFLDVYCKVQLVLIENNLQILLFNEEISYQVEFPQQLSFEFNSKKELCAITIYNLSVSDMESLENYEKLHTMNSQS